MRDSLYRGEIQTSRVNRARFAEREKFLRHGAGRLGLRERGSHPLVLDEAANQICQHRVPMLTGAAEFGGSFPMTHDGSSDSKRFGFFLGRLEQGRIDIHAQRQTERRQLFFDFVQ